MSFVYSDVALLLCVLGAAKHMETLSARKVSALAFTGIRASDSFGASVTGLADLNGDMLPDAVIGAPFDDSGGSDCGAVYVTFLSVDGGVKSFQKVANGKGSLTAVLSTGDLFGSAVASLGDWDLDLVPDVAAAAGRSNCGSFDAGALYFLFLSTVGHVKSFRKICQSVGGFTGTLAISGYFGDSVTAVPDLNADAIQDLVVGQPNGNSACGQVYVIFLDTAPGSLKSFKKLADGGNGFSGSLSSGDNFGGSLSAFGDLNGDAIGELAVGAPLGNSTDQGEVFIIFLATNGYVLSFQRISATRGRFTAVIMSSDRFGHAVASLGDIDGDQVPDLAASSCQLDDGGTDRGAVYFLFLDTTGEVKSFQKLSDTVGLVFTARLDNFDKFGTSLSAILDFNIDAIPDLLVGAAYDDDAVGDGGAVYVVAMGGQCSAAVSCCICVRALLRHTLTLRYRHVYLTMRESLYGSFCRKCQDFIVLLLRRTVLATPETVIERQHELALRHAPLATLTIITVPDKPIHACRVR